MNKKSSFNCLVPTIVFQEVPDEISLCFSITGCKVGCNGCHSTELWDANYGIELNKHNFITWLKKYQGLISCVVFFGGEWEPEALIEKLIIAKKFGLKTCLYSGEKLDEKHLDIAISQHLTFLKTGQWRKDLGGLENPSTNQIFRNVITGEKLNHLFIKQSVNNKSKDNQSKDNQSKDNQSKNNNILLGAENVAA